MSMNVPETVTAIALPKGFRYASAACGLRRKNRLDLGLIIAEQPVPAAGIFTQNLVKAAPVLLCQKHLETAASRVRAIVVNSGNANCAVGPSGMRASLATARSAAKALGCTSEQVLVCSTGVIGVPLPVEKILAVLPELAKTAATAPTNYDGFMQAILTTDTRPKWAAAACRIGGKQVRLIGCAKGAGMIHPNMATMLAYIVTDAAAPPQVLHQALTDVASRTFNSITVDGDTSTNDTALLLASGASGAPSLAASGRDFEKFVAALEKVCHALALAIVSDGEGASRVVEIEIRGAPFWPRRDARACPLIRIAPRSAWREFTCTNAAALCRLTKARRTKGCWRRISRSRWICARDVRVRASGLATSPRNTYTSTPATARDTALASRDRNLVHAVVERSDSTRSTWPAAKRYRSCVAVSRPRLTSDCTSSFASAWSRSAAVACSAGERGMNTGQQS